MCGAAKVGSERTSRAWSSIARVGDRARRRVSDWLGRASDDAVGDTASSARIWKTALAVCAVAVAVQSGFASLSDPDLPTHLSIGEWILAHHRVPYTEPFAWTRAGAPFYAYSWLAQVLMFAVLKLAGPLGLHLLAAIAGAAIVFASAAAARELGLRWSGAVLFAAMSAMVALESTPFLRPQLFMHILVPLAWLSVGRWRREQGSSWRPLGALVLLNAIAAGVHITFPVMAVPLVLLLIDDGAIRSSRFWLVGAAVLLGWLASPYALLWVDVFRLNFMSNALTKPPAPTGELTPGFLISPWYGLMIGALPILALPQLRRDRERLLYGALWLAGLLLFARIFKGLGPWWWCATPLCVSAIARAPRATELRTRVAFAALLSVLVASLAIPNVRLYAMLRPHEGDTRRRTLPSVKAFAAEPAARWIEQHKLPDAAGRVLTVFNYGSYLQWRMPSLSESIDGRTIFPDSASLPDAFAEHGVAYFGPWQSADLAIVPITYPVAAKLDADSGWLRIGVAAPAPWAASAPRAGLWVRRAWWRRAGKGETERPLNGVLR